jgi:hypothetical protein
METVLQDTVAKKPALISYTVKEPAMAERKAIWTRIGAAWAHKKGAGYSIRLDVLPIDGMIVLGRAQRKAG